MRSQRLQRFLREFELDYYSLAKLVIEMMEIPQPWVLSLDRTEWQFGSKVFNILTLGVVHQGVAFPLLWWMLDRKGNSNTPERVDLLKEFIELFCESKIAYLSADREFLGHDWLKYLLSQPMMPFRIRSRFYSITSVFVLYLGQKHKLTISHSCNRCMWIYKKMMTLNPSQFT